MNSENTEIRIKLLLTRLVDGAIFASLASIISYAIFYSTLEIGFEFLFEIFTFNLIIWLLFSTVSFEKKIFMYFLFTLIILLTTTYIILDKQELQQYFIDFVAWIQDSSPNPEFFTNYFIVFLFLLPVFTFKSSKTLVVLFWIFITLIFFGLSIYYAKTALNFYFLLSVPILFYIFFRCNYYKKVEFQKSEISYYSFISKKILIPLIPCSVLFVTCFFFTFSYKSNVVVRNTNNFVRNIVSQVEFLDRMSSRFSNINYNIETLGGNLYQSDTLNFKIKSDSSLLLRTKVFYEYTGSGFAGYDEEIFYDFSQYSSESKSINGEKNSYTIKIEDYKSNKVPVPTKYQLISGDIENYSVNQFGEVFFKEYFIKNDEFEVDYYTGDYSSRNMFRYIINDLKSENYSRPPETLTPLPETVTQRTIDLAQDIKSYALEQTAYFDEFVIREVSREALDNYITSLFINSFLERNFVYSETPGEIIGTDFVDSFLFELEEGYCTSFAATMYVMLRSLDIPCRYVTGFSVWNNSADEFVDITSKNRHAWVEVYFDGIGFIPFDPTPPDYSQETNVSSANLGTSDSNPAEPQPETDPLYEEELPEFSFEPEQFPNSHFEVDNTTEKNSFDFTIIAYFILFTLLTLSLFSMPYLFIKRKKANIENTLNSTDFTVVYENLIRLLAVIGLKQKPNETTREFMRRVYKYDRPFGTDEQIYKKNNVYSDFHPHIGSEMECVIKIIEKNLYAKDSDTTNITPLINFRNRIHTHIKSTKPKLTYLLVFNKTT